VAAIDADTYAGLKKASDGLRTMLKKSRDRDKTAGLLSSIMLLFQQRYGLDQQLLAELSGLIDDLDSSSAPVPEAYFARSLYYLINRPKDKADTPMNRLSDSPYLGVMARAVAALSDRNYKLATTEFQSLQKARPTSVLALRSLGDIMLAEGNLKAAEEWYTRAVGQNPAHAAAKVELAGISLENGEDRDKIVMQVKSVLSGGDVLHPKEIARAKFILGRTYTSMKMAKEAKEMLTAALAADPDNIEYLNALGRFYLENMEFDDAMGVFGKVLIKNRKEIRATVGLIQTMIEKRRIIEAGNRINDALSFAADNPELLYLKGRVEEEFERLDSAAAAYKGVVEKKKDYLEPRLALARVYKRQGKDQQAIAELDEAKTMFPDSNILRTSRGDLLIKLHKYPEAVEELKSAVDSDPYLTEARSQLGRAQIFAGDCESAVESFSVVLKQVERYPLARYRLAQAYHCLGEYDKAIAEYETALKSGRNDSRVLTQAGRAYSEKGDHVKGIELIQEALVFDRTNAEAYYHLGMAFRRKGDRDKAADAFKQAVSREPGNAQYRFMRGQALLRAGALPEAIEELSRTEEMEPKWAKVHFAKGRTYYQQKLFKAAIAEFQKAYNLEPDRVKALYKIGRSQMEMEDYKAAIKTFQELLRKFPDFHKVHYMLGRSLQQLGRKADAFAEYKKAAVLDKKNSMVHYYLGFMYKERRDFRNAAAHFKTYLDIAPNGPYARDIKDEMDFIAAGHHKMTSGDEIE
jgi:tetratricopeptide (TPR) repeat protein